MFKDQSRPTQFKLNMMFFHHIVDREIRYKNYSLELNASH